MSYVFLGQREAEKSLIKFCDGGSRDEKVSRFGTVGMRIVCLPLSVLCGEYLRRHCHYPRFIHRVFGGLVGGDGNPGPNSIDWSLGNSVPFGSMTDDMVFSTSTGDFMVGDNWKERMRITKDGKVGIGTTTPSVKLEVNGKVRADEFLTGDIVFHKGDKPVWRMYEDEKGLYVQSLTTDKNYALVLEELSDAKVVKTDAQDLEAKNQELHKEISSLKARMAKIESLLDARQ